MEEQRSDVTILSRQELYEQMWRTPALKLARQFGISDVGLAKICRRHHVPRPPRGYWAKLAHGKRVRQPPLPKLDDEALEEIRIFRNGFFGHDNGGEEERPERLRIVVPEMLADPHPLITATRKYLRSTKRGDDGLVRPDRQTCLDIRVTPSSVGRALLVFDTFVKEWERMGGKVSVGQTAINRDSSTMVELHDDRVPVELFEETQREAADGKADRYWSYRNRKYHATGKLVLQIGGACWGAHRRRWADGKRQRLESCVDSFIGGLVEILESDRLHRLDEQCVGRQRARVVEVREAAKKRKEAEDKRRASLSEHVSAWRNANEIRAYVDALRGKINAGKLAPTDPGAFAEWLDWATWYADYVDPLTPTPARPECIQLPKNTPTNQLDLTRQTRPIVQQLAAKDTDELFAAEKGAVDKLCGQWQWQAWNEICRVLEGLGYDVSGRRYHDW